MLLELTFFLLSSECKDNLKLLREHIVFFSSFLGILKELIFKSISKKVRKYVETTKQPFPVFNSFYRPNGYTALQNSADVRDNQELSRVIWLSRMLDQVQEVERHVAQILKKEREHHRMKKLLDGMGIREIKPKELSADFINKHFFMGDISLGLYILHNLMNRTHLRLVHLENHFLYITYKSIAYEVKNFSLAFSLLRKIGLNPILVARKLFLETLKKDVRDRLYYHLHHSGLINFSEELNYELLDLLESVGMVPSAQVAMKRMWSANFMASTAKKNLLKQDVTSKKTKSGETGGKDSFEDEAESLSFASVFMKFSDLSDFLDLTDLYLSGFTKHLHKSYEDEFKSKLLPVSQFSLFPEEEENFFDEQAKTDFNLTLCERCYDYFHKNESNLIVKKLERIKTHSVKNRVLTLLTGYANTELSIEDTVYPVFKASNDPEEEKAIELLPASQELRYETTTERAYFQSSMLILSKINDEQKLRIIFEFFPDFFVLNSSQERVQLMILQYLIQNDNVISLLNLPFFKRVLLAKSSQAPSGSQEPHKISDQLLGFKNCSFVFKEILFDSIIEENIAIDHELEKFNLLLSRLARKNLLFPIEGQNINPAHFARSVQFQEQVLQLLTKNKFYNFLVEYILSNKVYSKFPELLSRHAENNKSNMELQFLLCAFAGEESMFRACEYMVKLQSHDPEFKVDAKKVWEMNQLLTLAMLQYSETHTIASIVPIGTPIAESYITSLKQISKTFTSIFIEQQMPFKKHASSYDFSKRIDEFMLLIHGRNPFFEFKNEKRMAPFFQQTFEGQVISDVVFLLLVGMPFHALATLLERVDSKSKFAPKTEGGNSFLDDWVSFTKKLLTTPKELEEAYLHVKEKSSYLDPYLMEVYELSLARPLDDLYNRSVKRFLTFLGIENKTYDTQMSSLRRIYLHQYFKKTNAFNSLGFNEFVEYFFAPPENQDLFHKFYDKNIIHEIYALFIQLEPPFKDSKLEKRDPKENFSSVSSVLLNILRYLESSTRDLEFRVNDFSLNLSKRLELAKYGSPWKLVNEFCLINNLPVSLTLLHELARNNEWMVFLFECERQQVDQKTILETVDKYFEDPCLKSHLLIVLGRLTKATKASLTDGSPRDESVNLNAEKQLFRDLLKISDEFYDRAKRKAKRPEQIQQDDQDSFIEQDTPSSLVEYYSFLHKRLGEPFETQKYQNSDVVMQTLLKISVLRRHLHLPYFVYCLSPEKKLEAYYCYLYISFNEAQDSVFSDDESANTHRGLSDTALERLDDLLRTIKMNYFDDALSIQFIKDSIMWLCLICDPNLLTGMQLFCPQSPFIYFYMFWREFRVVNLEGAYQYLLKYLSSSEVFAEETKADNEKWIFETKMMSVAERLVDNAIDYGFLNEAEIENLFEMLYHSQFGHKYEDYYVALNFINKVRAKNKTFRPPKLSIKNISNYDAILMNLLRNQLIEEALAFAEYFDYKQNVLIAIELLQQCITFKTDFMESRIDEPFFTSILLQDIGNSSLMNDGTQVGMNTAEMILALIMGMVENLDPKLECLKTFFHKLGEIFVSATTSFNTPITKRNEITVPFLNFLIDWIRKLPKKDSKERLKEQKRFEVFGPFISRAIIIFLNQFELHEVSKSYETMRLIEEHSIGAVSTSLQCMSFLFKSKAIISIEDYERLKDEMLNDTEREILSSNFEQDTNLLEQDEIYLQQNLGKEEFPEKSKNRQFSNTRDKKTEFVALNKLITSLDEARQLVPEFWRMYLPINELLNILNETLNDRCITLYSIMDCHYFQSRESPKNVMVEVLKFIEKNSPDTPILQSSGKFLCTKCKMKPKQQRNMVLDILAESFLEIFASLRLDVVEDEYLEQVANGFKFLVKCLIDPSFEQMIKALLNYLKYNDISTEKKLLFAAFALFLTNSSGKESQIDRTVRLIVTTIRQLSKELKTDTWLLTETHQKLYLGTNLIKIILFLGLKLQNLSNYLITLITKETPAFIEPLFHNLKHRGLKLLLYRSLGDESRLLKFYSENGMKAQIAGVLLHQAEKIFEQLVLAAGVTAPTPQKRGLGALSPQNIRVVFNQVPRMLEQRKDFSFGYLHSCLAFVRVLEKVSDLYEQSLLFKHAIRFRRTVSLALNCVTEGFESLNNKSGVNAQEESINIMNTPSSLTT